MARFTSRVEISTVARAYSSALREGARCEWGVLAALLGGAVFVAACTGRQETVFDTPAFQVAPGLEVRVLAPQVWLHTTWREFPGGVRIPSNGLLVAAPDTLFLIDSAWGNEETSGLVEWAEREFARPVRLLVETHRHEDRVSGADYLHSRGVSVVVHPLTWQLAGPEVRRATALHALAHIGTAMKVERLELFYPGPGHTADNIVVWLPGPRILFAGCFLRPEGSSSLGNAEDADLVHWPEAVEKVVERYAQARVVVPGHGLPGGLGIAQHTVGLLRAAAPGGTP